MITHVAIRFHGKIYSLPAPNRHHNIIWDMVAKGQSSPGMWDGSEQGFLDENGKFYNRVEALEHAIQNNQLKNPNDIRAGRLFSEDVW